MNFSQQSSMDMFANANFHTSASKASGNADNSLLSVMYNRRTPMSPRQSKPAAPQEDTRRSPTCVSSHSIPIERNGARQGLDGSSSAHHLGEFYDQATWRMYERIQSARRELQYSGQGPAEMPSLDNTNRFKGSMPRLHPRRRDSLGQQQEEEQETLDYFDDAIFEMDM